MLSPACPERPRSTDGRKASRTTTKIPLVAIRAEDVDRLEVQRQSREMLERA